MHDPQNNPVSLLSVPNDFEAAMVVSALAAHEVDATTSGEFTSGFRAEAPGDVKVLVRQRDLGRAREVLDELENEPPADEQSWGADDSAWDVDAQNVNAQNTEASNTEERVHPPASEGQTRPSLFSLLWWFVIAGFAVWLIYR